MRRWLYRASPVVGAGALVVLVAVPVLILVALVGWPLPRSVPSWGALERSLDQPRISTSIVVKALAIAAWLIYAGIVAVVAREIAAVLRGQPAETGGPFGFVQGSVRDAVAAVAAGTRQPIERLPNADDDPSLHERIRRLMAEGDEPGSASEH